MTHRRLAGLLLCVQFLFHAHTPWLQTQISLKQYLHIKSFLWWCCGCGFALSRKDTWCSDDFFYLFFFISKFQHASINNFKMSEMSGLFCEISLHIFFPVFQMFHSSKILPSVSFMFCLRWLHRGNPHVVLAIKIS